MLLVVVKDDRTTRGCSGLVGMVSQPQRHIASNSSDAICIFFMILGSILGMLVLG